MEILDVKLGWAGLEPPSLLVIVGVKMSDSPKAAYVVFDPGMYELDSATYRHRSLYVRSNDLDQGQIEQLELPPNEVALVVRAARKYAVSQECRDEILDRSRLHKSALYGLISARNEEAKSVARNR